MLALAFSSQYTSNTANTFQSVNPFTECDRATRKAGLNPPNYHQPSSLFGQ